MTWATVVAGGSLLCGHEACFCGRVTHICVSKLTITGSDNGLTPGRRQTIIWTNAGILLIGSLGTNFSEILIEIYRFSLKKMHLKMSSGKLRPSCLGLNVLNWRASGSIRSRHWKNYIYVFDPCWVHDYLWVPLWVGMRFPVSKHQN